MFFNLFRYLGTRFKNVYPYLFLRQNYWAELAVFHLVGGLDILHKEKVAKDVPADEVPNSLDEWIRRDGVFCLKVKLGGKDIAWDVARTLEVSRIYHQVSFVTRTVCDFYHAPSGN